MELRQALLLKTGISVTPFCTEYDFDARDEHDEILLVAKGIDSDHTYLWVYTNNAASLDVAVKTLIPLLNLQGIEDIKLEDPNLTFLQGAVDVLQI